MGCIECEVPAAATRGRGGERTLEKGEKMREEFGLLTMRNGLSYWQKKKKKVKPLPIAGWRKEKRGLRGGR